ncbi:MAG: hypothetical protein M3Z98_05120 [Candidatus Dormibacteraeota bacterium]|nr:hypothetical protein [Candidatus Dormibacteraeota bacterium]
MARKQKRKGAAARAKVRQPVPAAPVATGSAPMARAPGGGRVGGDQALVRSVEMSLGGSAQIRGKGRNRVVLETGNPGIPLDRVPYFTSDLRQIAIVGGLMVVLLVLANFTVIPYFIK